MATLGHVTSTALNGADSPVFEKAGVGAILAATNSAGAKHDAVQLQLAAQSAHIADLTGLLSQLLAAQTKPVDAPVEVPVEVPVELTPQEKANITKAAKKIEPTEIK